MKKTIVFFLTMICSITLFAGPERKGFFFGGGLGGGVVQTPSYDGELANFNVRIGAGLTDSLLLMAEGTSFLQDSTSEDVKIQSFAGLLAAQYFIPGSKGWYVRQALGFGKVKVGLTQTTFSNTSDFGLASKSAAGYEFKFHRFGLGLEGLYEYLRLQTKNYHHFGGTVNASFYF